MRLGLIGLPLSGKTTVFNLLTQRREETSEFAGAKREAHVATIKVPDVRIERLTSIFQPKRSTLAEIEFVDLAGLELGQGGIPSSRLEEMRNLDALVHVLRLFESASLPPTEGSLGALADASALEQELILTDLIFVEQRQEKLRSDIGKGRKELVPELALMDRLGQSLGDEKSLRASSLSREDKELLRGYQLLSRLPVILLANTDESTPSEELAALDSLAEASGLVSLAMNAKSEWEITQLPPEDRQAWLEDLGVAEPARARFIQASYELLDLISFFTVGETDVRAWTIKRGANAQEAAGKIHTDLERGFIRAETIDCETFLSLGSMAEARKSGALRLEGKSYIVQDGDILTIRFSV